MKFRFLSIFSFIAILCSCWQEEVRVTGITLDSEAITVPLGESVKLTASLSPANADNQIVIWTTEDAAVAKVASDGTVTAEAPGQTNITAKTDDGGMTAFCKVIVPEVYVPVSSLVVDPEEVEMEKGSTAQVTATVSPSDATDPSVVWTSTDESVFTVSPKGVVTAIKAGSAILVAACADGGITASCKVRVVQHAGSLELSAQTLELKELQQAILTATVLPEDTVDKTVEWSSSNKEVATVMAGVVHAVQAGEADITATTIDGGLKKSCHVKVTCDVSSVKLSDHNVSLKIGASHKLEVVVGPERAADKSVAWSSSDATVVSVDQNGNLTALAPGTALVNVESVNNHDASDVCTVIVEKNQVKEVKITPASIEKLYVKEKATLTAEVNADATDKAITWFVDDPEIVTLTENGNTVEVLGLKAGKTDVHAMAGDKIASCPITVRNKVDEIKLKPESVPAELFVKNSKQLVLDIIPAESASEIKISWTSSNPEVAIVNQQGLVEGKAPGTVKIRAEVSDESSIYDECSIVVIQPVTAVSADSSISLYEGETKEIQISTTPSNAFSECDLDAQPADIFTYKYDKATNKVRVSGVKHGEAKLYISPLKCYADKPVSASCNVTVLAHVSSVSLNESSKNLAVGKDLQLTATVLPSYAANKNVKWSSSNASVASVSSTGLVHAAGVGICTITATTEDGGHTASCSITVSNTKVTAVLLDKTSVSIKEGEKYQLTAVVSPADAVDKSLTWTSSDEKVAKVSQTGEITAVAKGGPVTIKATSVMDKTIFAECKVTVTEGTHNVTGVSLSQTNLAMEVGDKKTLTATVLPSNATDKTVTWSSSKPGVATVSNGVVTAVAVGNTTITVTTKDGGKTATCEVTVTAPPVHVSSVSLKEHDLIMAYGNSHSLSATVLPTDAANKNLTWTSSNSSVATVSADGVVKAGTTTGTADITVRSVDTPSAYDVCKVTVKSQVIPLTGASLSPDYYTIYEGQDDLILKVKTNPSNADVSDVVWMNDVSGAVVLTPNGSECRVRGKAAGKFASISVTVTGYTTSEYYKIFCTIEVINNPVQSVTLNKSSVVMSVGESVDLIATLSTGNKYKPSNSKVSWSSSDSNAVSVTSGHVVALKPCKDVAVTVTSQDSGKTATCMVTVLSSGNGGNEGVEFDDWNF